MILKRGSLNLYKDYEFGVSIDYMFSDTSVVNSWELYIKLLFVLPKSTKDSKRSRG
jgi:hypothetical protein